MPDGTLDTPHNNKILASVTAVALPLFAALAVLQMWHIDGLFSWIGGDWGLFWAATHAFLHQGPAAAYDLDAIQRWIQPLGAYTRKLPNGPAPFPPPFFIIFAPFTWGAPVAGFAAWTVLSAAAGVSVIRSVDARAGGRSGTTIAIVLASLPFVQTLFTGQPMLFLLLAFYLAYRDLEEGRDFRAGLWLGALLLKPQYLSVLGLVLLAKRRWSAVAGTVVAGGVWGVLSLLVLGPHNLGAYLAVFSNYAGFQHVQSNVWPQYTVSWHGALIDFAPWLSERSGLMLEALLSVATLALLFRVWHGPWESACERFPRQILATMIVMLLVAHHTHIHSAVFLAVPGLILARRPGESRVLVACLTLGAVIPTVVFALTLSAQLAAVILIALLLLALGSILLQPDGVAVPSPVKAIAD